MREQSDRYQEGRVKKDVALRLIFYEQRMVGATGIDQCAASECWDTNEESGWTTNRDCAAGSGVTTVEPPVCSAAHGKALCCCWRVWDHPTVSTGAPAMRASFKSCGHMELDYRPEIDVEAGTVPTDAPGLPRTGPHRYDFVENFRLTSTDLGWKTGEPKWEDAGAYGYIRFTFYESLTPEVLSRYSDPPEMCADELLLPEMVNFVISLNQPLPACVKYPAPVGSEEWKSSERKFLIEGCSRGTLKAQGWCNDDCTECSIAKLELDTSRLCIEGQRSDHYDWMDHRIEVRCPVYPCAYGSRALLAVAILGLLF